MSPLWFLILLFICKSFSYPAKPLNERSTWQAWLLVDQSGENDLGMFRKRITSKSVFIAPTFSSESLPDCAEGYKSDTMGRCVKIIKINEGAHLDFIFHKLNEQFGDFKDYEDTDDILSVTTGPFQVNIPLDKDIVNEDYNKENNNEADIAIVLTPRSTIMSKTTTNPNHTIIRNNGNKQKFNIENVAEILGVNPKDVQHVETSTFIDYTTTTSVTIIPQETTTTTTDIPTTTTTKYSTIEYTTESTQVPTTITTTYLKDTTTMEEGEALFFLNTQNIT